MVHSCCLDKYSYHSNLKLITMCSVYSIPILSILLRRNLTFRVHCLTNIKLTGIMVIQNNDYRNNVYRSHDEDVNRIILSYEAEHSNMFNLLK